MKRREFLKSAALAVVAANWKRPAQVLPGAGDAANRNDAPGRTSVRNSGTALGVTPNSHEMTYANQWFTAHISRSAKVPPFSFVYDEQPSTGLLATWPKTIDNKGLGKSRAQRTVTWTDPNTGLQVRCVAVVFSDFPVVEWTVYFRNGGRENTPFLENIEGLDVHFERSKGKEFVLHQHRGDSNAPESYQPFAGTLSQHATEIFRPVGGRPTDSAFPYYNLQMPEGGVIIAVGWPGQWATIFKRDGGRALHVSAGQELTHLYLKPGEEIRAPLIALLFWQSSDAVRAQNLWRRWMLAHNLPRPGGQLPPPIYSFCDGAFFPGQKTSEAGEKEFVEVLGREDIKIDYWWIDAGWYPCRDDWENTGTWEPDPSRFPDGIKAVSDYVHAKGMRLIVWFEPERVTAGSWLAQNHPDWLLGGRLLNLGRPDVRKWITDHLDRLISEQGIDLYRQDFNMDPLDFWRKNDEPDRQGITENLYVQGYLAHFDELRHRHPDMLIDSCASGGRRNDLETMRRAVPLLRSDYQAFDSDPAFAVGNQGHTYGLSSWFPYYGQGVYISRQNTVYYARSHMCPAFAMAVDVRMPDINWNLYRCLVKDWRSVADCMLGDYYPLTPYTLQNDQWIAWQFNRPERGDGMIQAFRRDGSGEASMSFRVKGLNPAAQYEVTNLDVGAPARVSGRELLEKELVVEMTAKPGAVILVYRKMD